MFLAGRPGRARGGRGTAAYTRGEVERSDQTARYQEVFYFLPTPSNPLFLLPHPLSTPSHPLTDTYSGCGAGVQGNILAGAIAVPGRAAIRGTDDQAHPPPSQAPNEFQSLGGKLYIWTVKAQHPYSYPFGAKLLFRHFYKPSKKWGKARIVVHPTLTCIFSSGHDETF